MKKRRQYLTLPNQSQNLDSFLDVMTNTVGVLVFICLFVYLVAAQATKTIRTPIVSQSDKTPRFFEVREGRVHHLDTEKINQQFGSLISSLPNCYRPDIPDYIPPEMYRYYLDRIESYQTCNQKRTDSVEDFQAENKYYQIRLEGESLLYEPKSDVKGESSSQLTHNNSEFNTILDDFDPETEYLAFIVKADSYEAFRAAREVAWKQGFDVGWEPQTVDTELAFNVLGSGGRAVNIQ